MNPLYGTLLNFVLALGGLAETTGLTTVLQTNGGKTGAVALMVFSAINAISHGWSSNQAGPFASSATQAGAPRPRT